MKYDLTIVIPVYSERTSIRMVLDRVANLDLDNYEVIVVDDASRDGTDQIIEDWYRQLPAVRRDDVRVITHATNHGKGRAIRTALEQARGRYFIAQDADLEYDPQEIPDILAFAKELDAPAVYGSRFLGSVKGMPKPNYLANKTYNLMLRLLYRQPITDMHTCYKLVDTELLKDIELTSNGFDYAPELISKLLKRRVPVRETPIKFIGRSAKQGKKINWRDGIKCYYLLIKYRFSKPRRSRAVRAPLSPDASGTGHRGAGYADREARPEPRGAPDVDRLLPGLAHATRDHLPDER